MGRSYGGARRHGQAVGSEHIHGRKMICRRDAIVQIDGKARIAGP